jgi:hypothetical protein
MINILGENYYIDLDKVEEYLEINDIQDSVTNEDGTVSTEMDAKVNLIKFELVKMLLNTILTEEDDGIDEKLGLKSSNKTTIPFRLAFNTLLNKKLINHY